MFTKTLVATLALAVLLAPSAAFAQVEPARFIVVHYDRIDPAMTAAYEANSKEWVEAFTAAGIGKEYNWRGYQNGFTYAWVSDMPDYAWLDGTEERWAKAGEMLGEGKLEALEAGASKAILEHYTEIWKYEPEMSYQPAGFDPSSMNAVNVSIDFVKPGSGEQFRVVVKDAIAAMKKIEAPINFFAYSIPFGKGSYAFVSWAENRGALHSGPDFGELLTEAIGSEESQKLYQRYLSSAHDTEDHDWRARHDISYIAGAESPGAKAPAG
jgi:hypothetical protein